MSLHRLLYRSEVALVGTEAAIRQQILDIVRISEERNRAVGLTGALLHVQGLFIQALEGPLPALETTFERICCDLRHRRVELLELTQADARIFEEWCLARVTIDHGLEKLLPALDDSRGLVEDPSSAQATVQLMRSLLIASPGEAATSTAATTAASV